MFRNLVEVEKEEGQEEDEAKESNDEDDEEAEEADDDWPDKREFQPLKYRPTHVLQFCNMSKTFVSLSVLNSVLGLTSNNYTQKYVRQKNLKDKAGMLDHSLNPQIRSNVC